jgi:hypothetical protein
MASELRVDTLKDSSGNNSVGMSYVAQGTDKIWVNFNGTGTIAARDSNNLSSLTDNATGDYSVNLTTSMDNANYSIFANASHDGGGFTGQQNAQPKADFTPTTGSFKVVGSNSSNAALNDLTRMYCSTKGDLA